MGFYLSPIAFLHSHVPEGMQTFYYFNPLVGLIETFRWAWLDGASDFPLQAMVTSFLVTMVILSVGLIYFFRVERTIADVI